MKFSIIIPLYNKVDYVRKALDSILAQIYQDWECIVVDDGSTDGSASVVERLTSGLSPNDERISLAHQANAGVAAARNYGVSLSQGEYLAFLDADDWWTPEYLERMSELISRYPDAGLYASNYIYYKPGLTRIGVTNLAWLEQVRDMGLIDYPKSYYQGTGMPVWTGATMMSRKAFDAMGGFPVGIALGEDFLLWARTAIQYPVAYFNQPLAYYNNKVPSNKRATRNLHAPEKHMLFHLQPLEDLLKSLSSLNVTRSSLTVRTLSDRSTLPDWSLLFDKLRIHGLLDYYLDSRYRELTKAELKKVNWRKQPTSIVWLYRMPVWVLLWRRHMYSVGSKIKNVIRYLKS